MGSFSLDNYCISCLLDYLKSWLELKSRLINFPTSPNTSLKGKLKFQYYSSVRNMLNFSFVTNIPWNILILITFMIVFYLSRTVRLANPSTGLVFSRKNGSILTKKLYWRLNASVNILKSCEGYRWMKNYPRRSHFAKHWISQNKVTLKNITLFS